jgi:hypothetical protein
MFAAKALKASLLLGRTRMQHISDLPSKAAQFLNTYPGYDSPAAIQTYSIHSQPPTPPRQQHSKIIQWHDKSFKHCGNHGGVLG